MRFNIIKYILWIFFIKKLGFISAKNDNDLKNEILILVVFDDVIFINIYIIIFYIFLSFYKKKFEMKL